MCGKCWRRTVLIQEILKWKHFCVRVSKEKLFEDFNRFHPIAVVWVQRMEIQTQNWIMALELKWDLKMEFRYGSHEQVLQPWKLPQYLSLYLWVLAVQSLCSTATAEIPYLFCHFIKWLGQAIGFQFPLSCFVGWKEIKKAVSFQTGDAGRDFCNVCEGYTSSGRESFLSGFNFYESQRMWHSYSQLNFE